jgi:hypothetical protein
MNTDTLQNCMVALKNEILENICCIHHINDIFNVFLKTFLMFFESCFPIQSFARKQKNKRITVGIKATFKRKQGVYVLSKISKCPIMMSYYLHYCRILRTVIRRAKLLCYSNMISSSKNKS